MKLTNIYKELLFEDFKSQRVNFIKQGYDSNIVDDYIDKFKHIRDAKYRSIGDNISNFDIEPKDRLDIDRYKNFRDLEVFVDYVGGKHAVKTNLKSNDIVIDGKPIYNQDGIEVYYADSPRACIKYKGNVPYSWCVARSDSSNMFYTYRFKPYEPAFYFIKDVAATKKELGLWGMAKNVFSGQFNNKYHFFVIQVPKNLNIEDEKQKQYIVTSANNDGDTQMSWEDIVNINPKLQNIKEVLEPKPFTKEERAAHERFRKGIDDREFSKLSYEDKRTYLDVYPTINQPISNSQFFDLPDDLKNLYLSFGIGLSDEQFESIRTDKKLLKRYTQISEKKYEHYIKSNRYERTRLKMIYSEIIVLKENHIKEYLESLDEDDIYNFIKNNSREKLELLEKYVKQKLNDDYDNVKEFLIGLSNNDEDALDKFNEMLPDDVSVEVYRDYFKFELPYGFKLSNDISDLFDLFRYSEYGGGYNRYFDGDSYGLENTLNELIEKAIKDSEVSDYLKLYGFKEDVDMVKSLLDDYDVIESIEEEINSTYSQASEDAKQNAYDKLRDKFTDILEYEDGGRRSYSELYINKDALISLLFTKQNYLKAFTEEDIEDVIENLINHIILKNNLPDNSTEVYEDVDNEGWNFNFDENPLIEFIKDKIIESLESYVESDEEEGDISKHETLIRLNKTLKSLKQDESANEIENELVRIDFDRKRAINGQVYTKFYDKKNNKSYDGFMKISEIPNYFLNYKLFEEVNRINKIIKG